MTFDEADFNRWKALIAEYGSPLYVYDLDQVAARVGELRDKLPAGARLYYSLKSNPLPSLVRAAVKHGCCLEVTSANELQVASESGLDKSLLLYGGPGKTSDEITHALTQGVQYFSVESWLDLQRIDRIAANLSRPTGILFRVNPEKAVTAGLAMSGAPTQFGFEEAILRDHWPKTESLSSFVDLSGFHIYYGTQMGGAQVQIGAFAAALDCVERICRATGFKPRILNLGGGFPWAFAKPQPIDELADLRSEWQCLTAEHTFSANAELWFESGRYISASSGTLVATVTDIKVSNKNGRFVVLDTGINHLGGMAGLGRIPRGYTFLYPDPALGGKATRSSPATVVGPLCTPLDCMTRQFELPDSLRVGDLVAIPNVGAYGLTASLVAFLMRPPPMEIALANGRVSAVHRLRTGHEMLPNSRP